jgi:hypothetical protein
MSGVGFQIADNQNSGGPAWSLDRATFRDLYQRETRGTQTILQRSRHYVFALSRRVFGVTQVKPENRTTRFTFDFYTGPETQVAFRWIGGNRKFICTLDDLQIVDKKTGEALHTQQWEHYTKWKDVPSSEFGTTEDDD